MLMFMLRQGHKMYKTKKIGYELFDTGRSTRSEYVRDIWSEPLPNTSFTLPSSAYQTFCLYCLHTELVNKMKSLIIRVASNKKTVFLDYIFKRYAATNCRLQFGDHKLHSRCSSVFCKSQKVGSVVIAIENNCSNPTN